jgi:hypothetical protein
MLLASALLVTAVAGAGPPTGPSDHAATVARGRPSLQCRIVDLHPRAARRRGARQEREALARSRARARAALARQGRNRRGEAKRRGPYYSAARTLRLELRVAVSRRLPDNARVELRLFTPRGHLYQTLRAVVPPPTEPKPPRAEPVPASSRRRRPPRTTPHVLTAAVPVAGTSIVNHSLYGRWTVAPQVDGEPCGDPVGFWIGE